ncbi:MAG: hypothetical protein Q8L48_33460 [Archangium sp.]|nr:hypothetical protein [Archangium sp.]
MSPEDRVKSGAQALRLLLPNVSPPINPLLTSVIEFAESWPSTPASNPTEPYYSRQYKMEEEYWALPEIRESLKHDRAACLGGMAVFYEAYMAAISGGLVKRRPSGIADFDSSIWTRFAEALSEVGVSL